MRSPSITPLGPTHAPVHLVLCDFGTLGTAYVETGPVMTDAQVVDNILAEEYDHPLEVVAFSVSEDWALDVSEDIAGLIVERARSEDRTLSKGARLFVERHLDEQVEPELLAGIVHRHTFFYTLVIAPPVIDRNYIVVRASALACSILHFATLAAHFGARPFS